jgi:hypothetical protein
MKQLSICWSNRSATSWVWPRGLRSTNVWGGGGMVSHNWQLGGFTMIFLRNGFRRM